MADLIDTVRLGLGLLQLAGAAITLAIFVFLLLSGRISIEAMRRRGWWI